MTNMRLPVLQPDEISEPSDLFFCEPYKVTLMGRACVQRQERAKVAATFAESGDRYDKKPMGDYGKCIGCPLGRQLAARVGAATKAAARIVRGGGGRIGRGLFPQPAADKPQKRRGRRARICGRCRMEGHDRRVCPGAEPAAD